MCIRAGEESLSCAANTTFWQQKTADILTKEETMHTSISLKKKDLSSTPCNWQESISGSFNCLLSSQLDNENFLSLIRPDKSVRGNIKLSQSKRLYCSRPHSHSDCAQVAGCSIASYH